MKNIIKKILSVALCALLVFAVMCGCSASSMKDQELNYGDAVPGGTGGDNETLDITLKSAAIENRKLIKTVDIWAETKKFDNAVTSIESAIKETGGYIQQQSYTTNSNEIRTAKMTLRIPADKLDAFLASLNKSVNVTTQNSNVDDVTDEYIDVESHIASLEAEQASLLAMLEKAEKLDDVIAIQSRLTEVRGSLESYKARKKNYDTLVAYSTVNLYLNEVERETSANPGFWEQAGNAFTTGASLFGKMIRGIGIFLIGASPFLVVSGVTAVVIIIIVKKSAKKRKNQKESDKKEEE